MKKSSLMVICSLTVIFTTHCTTKSAVVEDTVSTPMENTNEPAPTPVAQLPNYPWGYSGEIGPENWGNLNPDYISCSQGKKQSPINLVWRKPNSKAPRMDFSYTHAQAQVDTTSQIPKLVFNGANQLLLSGKVYNLEHMEFHSPSEHQLSSTQLSMEIQFVHKAINGGGTAILSVFVIEGRENPLFNDIWTQFLAGSGIIQIDAAQLIPPSKTYYHYSGSLTSPPCTEGVDWIVFNTPAELSREQILAFRSKFTENNRPTQPLNGRKLSNH